MTGTSPGMTPRERQRIVLALVLTGGALAGMLLIILIMLATQPKGCW